MKILVVDDSKTMRHVLITQLKELGYESIIEADCVDKAKLLCAAEPPSLIISDWNMPGASGLELLKFIRGNTRTSDVPFVMLTTETDRTKIIEATRAGLQSYLLKPIRKPVLIEKMRELAAAYGFQAPMENGASAVVSVIQEESHPLKGKINSEQVEKILSAYSSVWNNETTLIGFEEFVAKEVFGGSLTEKLSEVELFMETLRSAAFGAVNDKLNFLAT